MRVHAAFWTFALEIDTPHTKEHVRTRRSDADESAWLSWKDGRRIRQLWSALPDDERQLRMEATPDSTFPVEMRSGIIDDRTRASTRPRPPRARARPTAANEGQASSTHATQVDESPAPSVVLPDPPSVTKLHRARRKYLLAQQRKAIVSAQIGHKGQNDEQMVSGLCAFLKHVGAEIMRELPGKYRERIANILGGKMTSIRAFPGGATIETMEDLEDRFSSFHETVNRLYQRYADAATVAIDECVSRGIPDPDPSLPSFFTVRPSDHPAYPQEEMPTTVNSSQVPTENSPPQQGAENRPLRLEAEVRPPQEEAEVRSVTAPSAREQQPATPASAARRQNEEQIADRVTKRKRGAALAAAARLQVRAVQDQIDDS